jgi:NAD(P)H-hydrate repair Nnr-like enzyme with NAD(P)H-hydrate dehydratase domain
VPDGHKGTYGHVLVAGGSLRMSGAGLLAARAALRPVRHTAAADVHVQRVAQRIAGQEPQLHATLTGKAPTATFWSQAEACA